MERYSDLHQHAYAKISGPAGRAHYKNEDKSRPESSVRGHVANRVRVAVSTRREQYRAR